ncbi:hypothetical protein [Streptomyces sp. NBC_01262]|uniref:hypothetical protein n=1 Tax=Streptomyces sp. NBC_01262 TaxID=2903803 RepID=UPI003FCCE9C1
MLTTAKVLAAAVRTAEDVDLVLAGKATTDGQSSAVPATVAGLLSLPQVTHARKLDVRSADAIRAWHVRARISREMRALGGQAAEVRRPTAATWSAPAVVAARSIEVNRSPRHRRAQAPGRARPR